MSDEGIIVAAFALVTLIGIAPAIFLWGILTTGKARAMLSTSREEAPARYWLTTFLIAITPVAWIYVLNEILEALIFPK